MWEVFDPRYGSAVARYRWRWQAKLACRIVRGLDYDEVL